MALPIEDYALIGDCKTAALVGRDGSVDWLCWPRFDSPACFAALLGGAKNGRWLIAARDSTLCVSRRYRPGTLVLETEFRTETGSAAVIDFMPPGDGADLVRIVIGRSGRVVFRTELVVRFNYGATVPWVDRVEGGALAAIAGQESLLLRTPVALHGEDLSTVGEFAVEPGQSIPFVLSYELSFRTTPPALDAFEALARTEAFWRDWSDRCPEVGAWTDAVKRSLITLKALTYAPTGGIVAAATTSLPESLGGVRNWDYRYCWLRDATFTLLAFISLGYYEEARAWRDWLFRAIAGSPSQIQIMYGVGGERWLPELIVDWLPGYEDSAPVRIGNGASQQLQLDVVGEVVDAMFHALKAGMAPSQRAQALRPVVLDYLATAWRQPDEGIWEVRGGRQEFLYSRLMCWVAVDRGIRLGDRRSFPYPFERWRETRDAIYYDIWNNFWDPARETFVQSKGSTTVDAANLLMPMVKFVSPNDPRFLSTLRVMSEDLVDDSLVFRYKIGDAASDGLMGEEGTFNMCSFWFAEAVARSGDAQRARFFFEKMLGYANHVGLYAEELGPRGEHLGNFPQAFTHLGLISAAYAIDRKLSDAGWVG
jgi:GH15 family glucan-1,4-alpha-glucosidase